MRSGRWIASPMSMNSTTESIRSSTSIVSMPSAMNPRRMLRYPVAAGSRVAPDAEQPRLLGGEDLAAGGWQQPGDGREQRRLARTVRADDADRVALGGVERHALEGVDEAASGALSVTNRCRRAARRSSWIS